MAALGNRKERPCLVPVTVSVITARPAVFTLEFLAFPKFNRSKHHFYPCWRIFCAWQIECDIFSTSEIGGRRGPPGQDGGSDFRTPCWTRWLAQDSPPAGVALRSPGGQTGICVVIGGKSPPRLYVDVPKLARFRDPRYRLHRRPIWGFRFRKTLRPWLNTIQSQSPDIAMGVDTGGRGRSGD